MAAPQGENSRCFQFVLNSTSAKIDIFWRMLQKSMGKCQRWKTFVIFGKQKMEFPWEQLTEWIGANSFVSIAPIVLNSFPLLSSLTQVDKQNLVVSAFPGDPLTGKAISLLNTHEQSLRLFFSILFYLEFNPQDPHSADASAMSFPFQNHLWKMVPKIRMKHCLHFP